MKKFLTIIVPILIAIIVFIAVEIFANQHMGKGALQVTSSPGSVVYVDGKDVGKTPLCLCELSQMIAVGSHTVRVVPQDTQFSPYEDQITITKGILTVVDRTFGKGVYSEGSIIGLTPLDSFNSIEMYIDSVPSGAQVLLDNNSIGNTPLIQRNITESDHEISISKDGFNPKNLRVHTVLGYRLSAKVYLSVNPNAPTISPTPIASPSATPSPAQVTILQTPTGFLRVHSNATINSSQVAKVYPGDTYPFVSETEGWFEIKLKNGINGWISNVYAKKE